MGLLNKWFKKKEKDQLEAVEKQEAGIVEVKSQERQEKQEKKETPDTGNKSFVEVKKGVKKTESKTEVKLGKAYEVLIRPIVSEKAAKHESGGIYSFIVNNNTNKVEIEKAIAQVYGVRPRKVSIMNMEGKQVRFGRQSGRRNDWKKAIVYLPKGQSINIHEGV